MFVIRKTLTEIFEQGLLDEKKKLIVEGQEVALVYFRCGYHPDQEFIRIDFNLIYFAFYHSHLINFKPNH